MVDRERPKSSPEVPVPLDAEIAAGLVFNGPLSPEDPGLAQRRLEGLLLKMRDDASTEYGACIAWCIGMSHEDTQLLNKYLIEAMGSHGQTDLPAVVEGINILWSGSMYGRRVDLRMNESGVGLDDHTVVDAKVYLLGGHSGAI